MALQTRHSIDPNFRKGGGLGVIEQLDLTTSYPQTVAVVDGSGNQITSFTTPAITGFATSVKQDTLLTELQLKADLTETQPVSIATMPSTPVTGTFWQATQPVSGTVTANLSATDNTVLDNIDTSTASHYITGIGHGVTTVTTAGTDVVLAASTACKRVIVQSQTDNTSLIAVGTSGVDATIATGNGNVLYPGDSIEIEIDNLADIYIDSLVNGEGVRYQYFT